MMRVLIEYQQKQAKARINLGPEWSVHPTDELLDNLRQLLGQEEVNYVY